MVAQHSSEKFEQLLTHLRTSYPANKSDLATKRAVPADEAQAYADENGLLFMEASAKTGVNVTDIFTAIGMT